MLPYLVAGPALLLGHVAQPAVADCPGCAMTAAAACRTFLRDPELTRCFRGRSQSLLEKLRADLEKFLACPLSP